MVGHNNLQNWYQTMWALRQHHKYDDAYMEEWIPYERDIYVDMTMRFLEEEKARLQQK